MIRSNYNVAATPRRFLRPLIPTAELRELAQLELLCFPPPVNYSIRTLRFFTSLNGAGLLRYYPDPTGQQQQPGPPVAFHLFDCARAELITLDVHPDHRRHGIATALLTESLNRLRTLGHRHVTCQIAEDNIASLTLHRNLGFRALGSLPGYYGSGRDALLMSAGL